jgi:hypothetical protein
MMMRDDGLRDLGTIFLLNNDWMVLKGFCF